MNRTTTQQAESKPRFRVGSTYFFGDQDTDIDEVEFEDEPKLYHNVLQFRAKDRSRCLYKWRRMSADEFVKYTLGSKLPMELGKFLVPEVAEYLGITIEHLRRLRPVAERLDPRHSYEKIIYDSYIKNGGFFLTQEQRDLAYSKYMSVRKGTDHLLSH